MKCNGLLSCHSYEEAKLEMIAFYSGITGWINEGKAMNVVFLGFSQALDTVCHDILIDKLRKCELDEQMVRWLENRLYGSLRGLWSVVQGLGGGLWCPPAVSIGSRSGKSHRMLCCHSEESWQVGDLFRGEPSEIHQRLEQGPAPGEKELHAPVPAGGWLVLKQLWRSGSCCAIGCQ